MNIQQTFILENEPKERVGPHVEVFTDDVDANYSPISRRGGKRMSFGKGVHKRGCARGEIHPSNDVEYTYHCQELIPGRRSSIDLWIPAI